MPTTIPQRKTGDSSFYYKYENDQGTAGNFIGFVSIEQECDSIVMEYGWTNKAPSNCRLNIGRMIRGGS